MKRDLEDRLFNFAVNVLKFIKKLSNTPEFRTIRYQLSKFSTSSGANYEEAQAASSKRDFINKVKISLKEMRESNYWLRTLRALINENQLMDLLLPLVSESEELKNILGSIAANAQKNLKEASN